MGVNSLPKTVTDSVATAIVNPGPSAPGSSTLTTRLPSHAKLRTNRPKVIQDVHSAVSPEQSVLNFCSTATRLLHPLSSVLHTRPTQPSILSGSINE